MKERFAFRVTCARSLLTVDMAENVVCIHCRCKYHCIFLKQPSAFILLALFFVAKNWVPYTMKRIKDKTFPNGFIILMHVEKQVRSVIFYFDSQQIRYAQVLYVATDQLHLIMFNNSTVRFSYFKTRYGNSPNSSSSISNPYIRLFWNITLITVHCSKMKFP